jgi:hypothetical protein
MLSSCIDASHSLFDVVSSPDHSPRKRKGGGSGDTGQIIGLC